MSVKLRVINNLLGRSFICLAVIRFSFLFGVDCSMVRVNFFFFNRKLLLGLFLICSSNNLNFGVILDSI